MNPQILSSKVAIMTSLPTEIPKIGNAVALARKGELPALPEPMPRLLAMGTHHDFRFPNDGPAYAVRQMLPDWQPPALRPETAIAAREALALLDAYLEPAKSADIAGRINSLLSHYFVPDMHGMTTQGIAGDWLDVLARYPFWAVEKACLDWISTEDKRRPTPAAIKARCERLVGDARLDRHIIRRTLEHHERTENPNAARAHRMVQELAGRMQMRAT